MWRGGVLATGGHGGDGASGGVGRVPGVLLRRKREQGVTIVGKLVVIKILP